MLPETDIAYDGDGIQSSEEKILNYLTKAYNSAIGEPSEEIALLKNDVQALPQDIIKINPLSYWAMNNKKRKSIQSNSIVPMTLCSTSP